MATYWLTFRIEDKTANGKDYSARYVAFLEAVKKRATMYWDVPTSFIAFESADDIDSLCGHLKKAISEAHDVFLVGMPEFKSARIVGANPDGDIHSLFTFLKNA